jgi:hypothetical protein
MPRTIDRSSLDGEPFYCTFCGMGWNEFQACEDVRCILETPEAAAKRAQEWRRKRPLDQH